MSPEGGDPGGERRSDRGDDGVPPPNPEWLKSVEEVGDRSAVVTVKTQEGDVRYLIPRISLFDFRPERGNGNGHNGHGHGHVGD